MDRIIILIIGIFIGVGLAGTNIETDVPVKETKVYISQRKDDCEKQGGKYNFYWEMYTNEYVESCTWR